MAGPALAWVAIGAAGREAAKKYGALIARKMFPKLFKKVDSKKKPPKKKTLRDHYKEEAEGNKKWEEDRRKEAAERRAKKRAFDEDMIKKEEARIKSKARPQNEIEAARDKEYAARKAYEKKHGSTADRINKGLKGLKDAEAKSRHNRN